MRIQIAATEELLSLPLEDRLSGERWKDYIFRILYKNIMSLDLYPGMPVSENALIERFSCSRTPVREALASLAECNLIDIFPQSGTYVAKIDYNIIRQMQQMRMSVETGIAEILCRELSSEYKDKIRNSLARQELLAQEDPSGRQFFPEDKYFHDLFYEAAGYPLVRDIMEKNVTHNDRLTRLLIREGLPYAERSLQEHHILADAIFSGDFSTAAATIKKHRMEYRNIPPLSGYEAWFQNA